MKNWIEVEGVTVEEAIKKALKELKLPRKKVKIEILSEEKRGLFGMPGAKPAKVRVSIIKNT
jgi:spoIIIJ-associated protein